MRIHNSLQSVFRVLLPEYNKKIMFSLKLEVVRLDNVLIMIVIFQSLGL